MLKRIFIFLLSLFPFMVACSKEEPPPPLTPQSAAPPTTAAPTPAPEAPPPATAPAAPTSGGGDTAKGNVAKGEDVYNKTCSACHVAGVAGAPKLGDKANWGPRIAQGNDTLYTHALKGFQGKAGMMPPKGGNMALSDEEVKAAVDYMVAKSK